MASGSSFSPSDQSMSEEQARCEDAISRMARIVNESFERLQWRLHSCRVTDLNFFPEFGPPKDFKLPKFDIYDGLGCPVSHIFTYTSDLVQVGATEEALIRLFYKSLQGPALEWLLTIDHSFSEYWVDWALLFINRYDHNVDVGAGREWQRHIDTKFDLCFFPEFRLPKHFQVPKLSKYTGQECPITHLFVYCRDLRFLGADDETLVCLFYKSLAGPALGWFLSLDRFFSLPWMCLSQYFVDRYHDNIDARMGDYGGYMLVENAAEFEKFCPFSDFRLPKMFKVPKFQKYDGRGCPISHLFVYRQQLRQLGGDDKPLVCLFYKSLAGLALRWLVSLDHCFVSSWCLLSQLFFDRFRSDCDAIIAGQWNMIPSDQLLLPKFQLPDKLGVLEFEKYDGNGCPITHMFAYCEDLRQLRPRDDALVSLFYKSLAGPALAWFASISNCFVTWKLVVELFVDRYSFQSDVSAIDKWNAVPSAEARLFPGFHLPDKFKVPRFEKYNGQGCPVAHLFAYCQELRQQGADAKVLICLFYKSLTGPALRWFVSLDRWVLMSWEDLSGLFIDRYSRNIDPFLIKKQREIVSADGYDWCFFPDFRLSNDFKVPKFKKYSGEGCPIDHLCAYRRDLHGLGVDEEMLICLFHKSLTGPAFRWFVSQDHCSLNLWEKLSALFCCSYCTLIADDPKKIDLMALRQGDDESFSDYVYRWGLSAARIIDKRNSEEQIKMVKQSAHPNISGYLMLFHFKDFTKLIQGGSRIEHGIKDGVIDPWPSISGATQENSNEKKDGEEEENAATLSALKDPNLPTKEGSDENKGGEGEENAATKSSLKVSISPTKESSNEKKDGEGEENAAASSALKDSNPSTAVSCQSPPIVLQGTQARCPRRRPKGFIPVGQSYSSILALLLEKGLLTALQPIPLNPQSKSYDAKAHCAYHQGPGHSTENCFKLKHDVQDLFAKGKIVIAPPTK